MAGVTLNNRRLAADVRTLSLRAIKKILEEKEMTELKKQLILKLAPTVLPRINEHTGEDGSPITINLVKYGEIDSNQRGEEVPEVRGTE